MTNTEKLEMLASYSKAIDYVLTNCPAVLTNQDAVRATQIAVTGVGTPAGALSSLVDS